jgi:hypothetical protein
MDENACDWKKKGTSAESRGMRVTTQQVGETLKLFRLAKPRILPPDG